MAVNAAGAPVEPVIQGDTGDTGGVVGDSLSGNTVPTAPQFDVPGQVTTVRKTTTVSFLPTAQRFTHVATVITNPNGPLYTCPVHGSYSVGDSFGAPRYAGGYHPHAGNDIFADQGTPIVAPFDGVAENAANSLGGNAVIVRGAQGYVYNAHLVAYGRLGQVHAGDVIGFVGNTGDAQGTAYHDHFEWHPYDGGTIQWIGPYGLSSIDTGSTPAVDPFPYLVQACPH